MTINNPFTNGQIKNYLLFYVSIVVIMILFFIATTLFNDIKKVDKKLFKTEVTQSKKVQKELNQKEKITTKFKLLDKGY